MPELRIEGGNVLRGRIRTPGSKNAVLPMLAATILTDDECVLRGAPDIADARSMTSILRCIGADVEADGDNVRVDCAKAASHEMPKCHSREIRSSIFLLGPVVSRFHRAVFHYPGGCDIGLRPVNMHIAGLRALGIDVTEERGVIECRADRIRGANILLPYPSVGATENILMAATLAEGDTVIKNAAREPEIAALAGMLNAMGARITGAGTSIVRISGVNGLHGVTCEVPPDRIVAGTYMIAAASCGGCVTVERACCDELELLIRLLRDAGAGVELHGGDATVSAPERLTAFARLITAPYPGFPTDLQPQMAAAAATAKGVTRLRERVFDNRLRYAAELNVLGAEIDVRGSAAMVRGVPELAGGTVTATDLRAGAALVIAAMRARGRSVIKNAQLIDRGYCDIAAEMASLGASITREDD